MWPLKAMLAGVFLPLFPLSMIFNAVFGRIRNPALRVLLLLLWPQAGLGILAATGTAVPHWITLWALATALLYALRALVLHELGLWIAFVATSAWALLWIPLEGAVELLRLQFFAFAFSAPLILLALLGAGLERRFGAAYTGVVSGLAQTTPRYAGVLVVVILAAMATPLFPNFFTMLATVVQTLPAAPGMAIAVALVWLLWSWAGARLLQGLIVGPRLEADIEDLGLAMTWTYTLAIALLLILGVHLTGDLL